MCLFVKYKFYSLLGLVCTTLFYVKSEIRNVTQENQAPSSNKDAKVGFREYLTCSLPLNRFERLKSRRLKASSSEQINNLLSLAWMWQLR